MNTANTAGYPSKRRQIAAANRLLDPAVRREIRADPKRYALDNGLLAADAAAAEVRVVTSTRDTLYIQLPNPRAFADTLDAPTLKRIQAAACTGGISPPPAPPRRASAGGRRLPPGGRRRGRSESGHIDPRHQLCADAAAAMGRRRPPAECGATAATERRRPDGLRQHRRLHLHFRLRQRHRQFAQHHRHRRHRRQQRGIIAVAVEDCACLIPRRRSLPPAATAPPSRLRSSPPPRPQPPLKTLRG